MVQIAQELDKSQQSVRCLFSYEEELVLEGTRNTDKIRLWSRGDRHFNRCVKKRRTIKRRNGFGKSSVYMPEIRSIHHKIAVYISHKGKRAFCRPKARIEIHCPFHVLIAYRKVQKEQKEGRFVVGPKQLNVFGAPYIWSILKGIGLLKLPEKKWEQYSLF